MLDELSRKLRVSARGMARAGLVHAYGHCSARIDEKSFLVTPSKALGLIKPGEELVTVSLEGELPPGALPEVILHQEIFRRRPDVRAIARFQSPNVMALSALGRTSRVRHGFGSYFSPCPPMHRDPRLVRDRPSARTAAETLGSARALVLRGNGAVTTGATLEEAVTMAWYLEDAARVELVVLATGLEANEYSPDEVRDRAITGGRLIERMFEWLTAGDPETT